MALRGTRGGCNGTREMKKVISHPDADRSRMYKQTEMALRGPAVSHLACNGTRENEESNFSSGCRQIDRENALGAPRAPMEPLGLNPLYSGCSGHFPPRLPRAVARTLYRVTRG